ncbi:phosphoribosylanthranilate isomerase [Acidiferrimicrobium sp. IK]|uniref:phosphoribosylanthranilate isomerase n=1 Tax=Acidiferrimicrobium sp. IK TaxID=2871700 RepID=UPI0021CB6C50|nr:phosphoribosylanthranilate isomerase [Acidiferrimicrobium sp. IK]MCU4183614.1 phosphoribosylanthranilate isomerase [Acidiferrimicrobium sp. IK]
MFVKICGTTSEDDALLAVAMGADAVGFIFAPSPRQIAPQKAADIVKRLPSEIMTVGVFRNEAPQRVVEIVQAAGLRGAQLHGRESAEQATWVRRRIPWLMQAFAAGDARVSAAATWGADAILLDAPNPGSGQVFDWALASEVPGGQRLVIAGGLNPGNVAAAVAQTKPWGVDVVSGVEKTPGQKDPVKLRAFIAAARAAEPDDGWQPDSSGPYDWQEG